MNRKAVNGAAGSVWAVRKRLGVMLVVQNLQKETYFHENKHDERHIYIERRNRDNDNQDARNYNLRTHKEMNENPTYKHDTDTETENKDNQKYIENHNQTIKHTFKGRLILEDKSRHAIDDKYGRFNT